jgi:hypothetical protein
LLLSKSAATWQTTSLSMSLKASESASMLAARWHPRQQPGGIHVSIQVSSHVTSVNNNLWRSYFVKDSELWFGLHGPWATTWRSRYVEDHVWFKDRWMVASRCDEWLTMLCGLILG